MKNAVATLSLASVCLAFAGMVQGQSLAEIAKKEKARRAKISETKTDDAPVVGERALRNANGSTFAAVEVTGARARGESPLAAANSPAVNPNKRTATPPKNASQATARPSTPKVANTELGRGWSEKSEPPPGGKGWNPRRKEILESMGRTIEPIHPRTVQERDRNRYR
jgi:hypothetical protein